MTDARESQGHLFFSGDDRLEGVLEWPPGPEESSPDVRQRGPEDGPTESGSRGDGAAWPTLRGGVVVAHPHPLYGGTMAQPVVYRVARACRERGFAALRFNFRGVGGSRGHYSGSEEHRDVEAAVAFLRGRLAAREGVAGGGARPLPVGLAGYSFGSVMAAVAAGAGAVAVDALALIALVVDWDEWQPGMLDGLSRFRGPVLAVCGESDDLAPPASVERALEGLGLQFRMETVTGANHLFEQRQREVGERVASFFAAELPRRRQPARK